MINIFIITERRADYSRFKPILELIIEMKIMIFFLKLMKLKPINFNKGEISLVLELN